MPRLYKGCASICRDKISGNVHQLSLRSHVLRATGTKPITARAMASKSSGVLVRVSYQVIEIPVLLDGWLVDGAPVISATEQVCSAVCTAYDPPHARCKCR